MIDTGDMRALPYPDQAFDVIASMTAIHNVPDREGRAQAIREMWRVIKPGGEILVSTFATPAHTQRSSGASAHRSS